MLFDRIALRRFFGAGKGGDALGRISGLDSKRFSGLDSKSWSGARVGSHLVGQAPGFSESSGIRKFSKWEH
jgi:hypothetical protein